MKYYVDVAARWELTPAESRAVNQECMNMFGIGGYPYDSHDAWHFLSATAIFFAFNVRTIHFNSKKFTGTRQTILEGFLEKRQTILDPPNT